MSPNTEKNYCQWCILVRILTTADRIKKRAKTSTGQLPGNILHQDNAPVHMSCHVQDTVRTLGIETLPNLPYSPDLAICEF